MTTINLLQHLPGLHIEYPMMDTLDTPSSLATVDAVEEDAQWVAIKADALEGYHPLINAMIAADIPCPDRVGEDVMDGNRVVTMAELGWRDIDLWITDNETEPRQNIIEWDLSVDSVPQVIADLTTRFNQGAPLV